MARRNLDSSKKNSERKQNTLIQEDKDKTKAGGMEVYLRSSRNDKLSHRSSLSTFLLLFYPFVLCACACHHCRENERGPHNIGAGGPT
jgi:hypothetical protein